MMIKNAVDPKYCKGCTEPDNHIIYPEDEFCQACWEEAIVRGEKFQASVDKWQIEMGFDALKSHYMDQLLATAIIRLECGEHGPEGTLDKDMIPYLIVLNAMPDVFTWVCCSNHLPDHPTKYRADSRRKYGPERGYIVLVFREVPDLTDAPHNAEPFWMHNAITMSFDGLGGEAGLEADMMKIINWVRSC